MWNSPNKETEMGTRYSVNEIAPLVSAIGLTLDGHLRKGQIGDRLRLSRATSFSSLNLGQYVYAVYRTCDSLLGDGPAPKETPPDLDGIVRDMLHFLHDQVQAELKLDSWIEGEGSGWMHDTWRLYQFTQRKRSLQMPALPRFEAISPADWEKVIFEGIAGEFLSETPSLAGGGMSNLAVQEAQARFASASFSVPEPSLGEFMMASHYLLYLVWAAEAVDGKALSL